MTKHIGLGVFWRSHRSGSNMGTQERIAMLAIFPGLTRFKSSTPDSLPDSHLEPLARLQLQHDTRSLINVTLVQPKSPALILICTSSLAQNKSSKYVFWYVLICSDMFWLFLTPLFHVFSHRSPCHLRQDLVRSVVRRCQELEKMFHETCAPRHEADFPDFLLLMKTLRPGDLLTGRLRSVDGELNLGWTCRCVVGE